MVVDRLLKTSAAIRWTDDECRAAFEREQADESTLRCIRYMHEIEFHTVDYLSLLLSTAARADPHVARFLSVWAYEELWHAEALGAVLRAHGEPGGISATRFGGDRRRALSITHLGLGALSALAPETATGLVMTWGALNESMTQFGYSQLARMTSHAELGALLSEISYQESRHAAAYLSFAGPVLERSRGARVVTRRVLTAGWQPVGTAVMGEHEADWVFRHVYRGHPTSEWADRVDRRIGRLPGMAGANLVSRALRRADARAARTQPSSDDGRG